MAGKFTQHVHNLGYATGKSIHSLLIYAGNLASSPSSTNKSVDGSASASSPDISSSWPTSLSWLGPLHEALRDASSSASSTTGSCTPDDPSSTVSSISSTCTNSDDETLPFFQTVYNLIYNSLNLIYHLPSRYKTWWWNLLQSDPLHVLVETLLIVMCIILVVLQRRADWRMNQERKKSNAELTEKEVEELLREWKETGRKPLGGPSIATSPTSSTSSKNDAGVGSGIIIDKIEGNRLFLHPDSAPYSHCVTRSTTNDASDCNANADSNNSSVPSSVLNFATFDYLSSTSSPLLRRTAITYLAKYGVGSCGPRGFYGTIDAHLKLESVVSEWLGTEDAILYSDGASAATSTVAAFAKRGDLLIVDEGVNEALLVGVSLSRANVRYFRHNDVNDLRRILEKVRQNDQALGRRGADQRRFLVVEGLYRNWGTVAPLEEIVALKEEFHYRLILDDSHGIGTLGPNGRGTLEHYGLSPMIHCEIMTFSLENALGSVGGMTVGSEEVVDHQRLSGAGYCFSASAPPFLSEVCVASVRKLQGRNYVDVDARDTDPISPLTLSEPSLDPTESPKPSDCPEDTELSGEPLLQCLHQNISTLYATLTDSSHPHASKLRNRLVITSHPLSPLIYLRLADGELSRWTRAEQSVVLDQIAKECLMGGVAIVSTGGHVKNYLHLVPEPSLRVVANVSQKREDVEVLVEVLGKAVDAVLGEKVLFA